jgi:hypothetical protein
MNLFLHRNPYPIEAGIDSLSADPGQLFSPIP